MGEVVDIGDFGGETKLDIEPDKVLEGAVGQSLSDVIVIGYDKDDTLYFAASSGDPCKTLWAIEQAKQWLIENG
jgi:hypothetical protein